MMSNCLFDKCGFGLKLHLLFFSFFHSLYNRYDGEESHEQCDHKQSTGKSAACDKPFGQGRGIMSPCFRSLVHRKIGMIECWDHDQKPFKPRTDNDHERYNEQREGFSFFVEHQHNDGYDHSSYLNCPE